MWHNQALILLGHVCILRKKFWPGAELYSAPPALRWSPYMPHTHAHKHFAMYIAPYALHCNGGPVRKQLLFIFIEISCFLRLLYFWVREIYSLRQIECLCTPVSSSDTQCWYIAYTFYSNVFVGH